MRISADKVAHDSEGPVKNKGTKAKKFTDNITSQKKQEKYEAPKVQFNRELDRSNNPVLKVWVEDWSSEKGAKDQKVEIKSIGDNKVNIQITAISTGQIVFDEVFKLSRTESLKFDAGDGSNDVKLSGTFNNNVIVSSGRFVSDTNMTREDFVKNPALSGNGNNSLSANEAKFEGVDQFGEDHFLILQSKNMSGVQTLRGSQSRDALYTNSEGSGSAYVFGNGGDDTLAHDGSGRVYSSGGDGDDYFYIRRESYDNGSSFFGDDGKNTFYLHSSSKEEDLSTRTKTDYNPKEDKIVIWPDMNT